MLKLLNGCEPKGLILAWVSKSMPLSEREKSTAVLFFLRIIVSNLLYF